MGSLGCGEAVQKVGAESGIIESRFGICNTGVVGQIPLWERGLSIVDFTYTSIYTGMTFDGNQVPSLDYFLLAIVLLAALMVFVH